MNKLALLLLAAVSVVATAAPAAAQGYGGGYRDEPPPHFRPPYRDPEEHARWKSRRGYHDGFFGGPVGGGWNTFNGCPPGFTVQDGICKPYLGGYGGGWNTWNGCPPDYTIQGGRCLPYRGP
jgi:hypothetical protein